MDPRDPRDPKDLVALYDHEHRRAVRLPGYETIQTDAVTRCLAPTGQAYVFWQNPAHDAHRLIEHELSWHRSRAKRLTWKIYSHDVPPGFEQALLAHGFVSEGPANRFCALRVDAFMKQARVASLPDGYRISRLSSASELPTLIDLYGHIWPDEDNALWLGGYEEPLARGDDGLHLYCVRSPLGQAAACAGMIHHEHQHFGHLFGGGTHPEHRRRGLHGALTAMRAQALQARGGQCLIVDAGDESYPLLAKRGFEVLGQVSFYSIGLEALADA